MANNPESVSFIEVANTI